jgi:hypothetical protein
MWDEFDIENYWRLLKLYIWAFSYSCELDESFLMNRLEI